MVDFRRDLHMYPELSFEEDETPKKIAEFLSKLGLEVKTEVGGRGVVGYLKGGKPGKTVALRADFDALPIQDEKDVSYKSRIPGVMHACGHDLHTAALLGVAKVLSEVKDEIAGNIVFIHQFAEEKLPGGAKPMIEDGCLDGVDVIYGAHVSSNAPIGMISLNDGSLLAAADSFEIQIQGRGGHGASPHMTVDSVVVGCQLVMNLQQIVSRKVDPLSPAVVTVGTINAGQNFNVISDTAQITGTVRTLDEEVRSLIENEIDKIVSSTCAGADATAKLTYTRGYPDLTNDKKEANRITSLSENIFGEDMVSQVKPIMGGEDFAYYLKEVPGAFFFVGAGNEQINATYPHHHPKFDADERSMINTGKVFIAAIQDYLNTESEVSGQEKVEILR
ncbi:M20 family metallopeptidase [Chryseomicrobium palamuruense]|uniref:M20 family metallopeptidase n=1 Tax=Chryseomicrobium palamuruense TaxID=682973 RepID=A0ABV8UTT6_9BACL